MIGEDREKERLEKGLAERDEVNGKLKELLKTEQSSAERLRTEVIRLVFQGLFILKATKTTGDDCFKSHEERHSKSKTETHKMGQYM